MLYAKINPKASFVKQEGPFTAPITVEAEYLTALARPYAAGAAQTNFEVQFGNVILNEEGIVISIQQVSNSQLMLTAKELVNWGADDSVLLEVIAAKLGTVVESTIDIAGNQY
jgi:hypothetical protein